jgi:hypothetical protein
VAWDSSRPVPWVRLLREWAIYVGIMIVLFAVLFRDRALAPIVSGLLISGPLYLLFGGVMAKLGYQRRSIRQVRADTAAINAAPAAAAPRPKPAATKRTGANQNRPGKTRR